MALPSQTSLYLNKINEWRKKASEEVDPFNAYISCFIAFNILYNLYAMTKDPHIDLAHGDAKRAVSIKEAMMNKADLVQKLGPKLTVYLHLIPKFVEEYWQDSSSAPKVAISAALKTAFTNGDHDQTLEYLLKWLYKVRCNLFHGVKRYKDQEQREILSHSTPILDTILIDLLTTGDIPRG